MPKVFESNGYKFFFFANEGNPREPMHIHIEKAQKIWFDENNLWLSLTDGRKLAVPLTYFPRLLNATPNQLQKFEISGGGIGLHWDDLDEDISVPGLLLGNRDLTLPSKEK